MSKSDLEATFLNLWGMLASDMPEPVAEHRFAPPRRFRLDFSFLDHLVAVELQGGTWIRGRHVRGKGYASDCEKRNLATSMGWRVFYFTTDMLERDPAGCIDLVRVALGGETLPFTDIEFEKEA